MIPILATAVVVAAATAAGPLDDARITDPAPILEALRSVRGRARVMVTLVPTPAIEGFTAFDDPEGAALHRRETALLEEEVLSRLPSGEVAVRFRMENFPCFSCDVTRAGLEAILGQPDVEWIEPVALVRRATLQGIRTLAATQARAVYRGDGISIAIVDTGIDYTHPDLGGGSFPNGKVIGGWDFGNNDANPMDGDAEGHGTSCAGIAAGWPPTSGGGNFIGGVAPNARLYALKIYADGSDTVSDDTIAAAWDWCVTHKNDSPSNPILTIATSSGDGSWNASACDSARPGLAQAASNCAQAEIMLFVSAGNDGFCDAVASPACVTDAIAVGAVYDETMTGFWICGLSPASCIDVSHNCGGVTLPACLDNPAMLDGVGCFSNSDDQVLYLAPSFNAETPTVGGGYNATFGGTSAAAPYAAGAYAVYQSAHKRVFGTFQPRSAAGFTLALTGDPITDPKSGITTPRLNLRNAIGTFAPANDYCADAVALQEGVPYVFSSLGATTDGPDEPTMCDFFGYTQVDADVWFTYRNDCGFSQSVTASLCASSFDTKVAVYEGACPSPTEPAAIACNDDSCGTRSEVTFVAQVGTLYYIRVGGYLGDQGDGVITVTQNLANDVCSSPYDVYLGSTVPFCTMSAATDGPAEPGCNFCCGDDQIHKDLFFRYTAKCSGDVTASLCGSDFDTKMAIYEGGCPGSGTLLLCNDDACGYQSEVTFPTQAGQSYLIRVGGYNDASGHGLLALSRSLANDDCATPQVVQQGSWPFCNEGALTDGPVEPTCGFYGNDGIYSDLWFRYDAELSGFVTAKVCDPSFKSRMAVYDGGCPPTGSLIGCSEYSEGCNFNSSQVAFLATVGRSYWIRVGGDFAGEGAGVLQVIVTENSIADCQGIDGENVLRINGNTGQSSNWVVQASGSSPILFSIDLPSGGGNGKFVVHMNRDVPTSGTITPLPAQLGPVCFPMLLSTGASPVAIWTNIHKATAIGESNFFGEPIPDPPRAPTTFYDSSQIGGFPLFTTWTLQGVILNPNASSARGGSVTNASLLRVVP